MSKAKTTPKKKPKPKKGKGRPRKDEAWRLKRFVEGTRKGLTRKLAAQYAGLGLSTVEKYLSLGRVDENESRGLELQNAVYRDFVEAVQAAESEGAAEIMERIKRHARKDWRAGAWILNNRHGDEYKSKQVVAGDPDAPLGVREVLLPARRKDDE